jgi:hypothetical protein
MGLIMCTSKYGAISGVMSKFDDIAVSPVTDAKTQFLQVLPHRCLSVVHAAFSHASAKPTPYYSYDANFREVIGVNRLNFRCSEPLRASVSGLCSKPEEVRDFALVPASSV